jgi:hypothetical protein
VVGEQQGPGIARGIGNGNGNGQGKAPVARRKVRDATLLFGWF